jgi:hypothetical protein
MSLYTVADLKSSIEPKLHDQSLNKMAGSFYDKIDESVRNMLLALDIRELKRYVDIQNAVHQDVHTYVSPDDINGDRAITIRPIQGGILRDKVYKSQEEEMTLSGNTNLFAFDYVSGIKTLKLQAKVSSPSTLVNESDDLTDNGTWAIISGASGLQQDKVQYISSSASVRFTLSAGTTASVDVTDFDAVDLTLYSDNGGSMFAWLYLPADTVSNVTPVTSIQLRWGQNAANYKAVTVTRAHDASVFKVGWNLVRFDFDLTGSTGFPTDVDVRYMRFVFTYTAISGGIVARIDQVTARQGAQWELGYYSNAMFKDAVTGELKDKPDSDTDIILLEKDSFNVLFHDLSEVLAQEIQGEDSAFDVKYWQGKKKDSYDMYKLKYPSEAKAKKSTYYRQFRPR